jgi:23S rRNA pseudouridine1911/1915/1917 synthase
MITYHYDKPAGVATQPSHKHPQDNIISMVATYYKNKQINANIHILTRLDYQKTGLMVVAKSGVIQQMLSDRKIVKKYLCDIRGKINPPSGLIDLPIKRVVEYDIRRWVDPDGQKAQTKYQTIEAGQ